MGIAALYKKDKPIRLLGRVPGVENSRVNFTRNNPGIRWNRQGYAERIAADKMRYNFNPKTGIYEGRVFAGPWTNEILDPRDMTTGNWDEIEANVAQDAVGIDGKANAACTVTGTSASNDNVRQDVAITANTNTHLAGAFLKKNQGQEVRFLLALGNTGITSGDRINTDDGTTDSSDVNVEDFGNWWFVWTTVTNDGTYTGIRLRLYSADSQGSTIWDAAQVFLNRSFPPPVPVFGTQAGQSYTQDPDIAKITDMSWFNPQEGTFVTEVKLGANPSEGIDNTILAIGDGTTDNVILLRERRSAQVFEYLVISGGTQQTDIDGGSTAINTSYKVAITYKEDDFSIAVDGSVRNTDTNGDVPNFTNMSIGYEANSAYGFGDRRWLNGFIKYMDYYPLRLSNAKLQALTS